MAENNTTSSASTQSLPNSTLDMGRIVKDMKTLNTFTVALIDTIKEWSKVVKQFEKIDVKSMDGAVKNIGKLKKSMGALLGSMGDISAEIVAMSQKANNENLEKVTRMLMGNTDTGVLRKKTTKEGDVEEIMRQKEIGLIDAIVGICGIGKNVAGMEVPNPMRFKMKFNKILKLFEWSALKVNDITKVMRPREVKTLEKVTMGLMEVMQTLPAVTQNIVDMFSGIAVTGQVARGGASVFLGKDRKNATDLENYTGGLLGDVVIMAKMIETALPVFTNAAGADKQIQKLNRIVTTICTTFALAVVLAPAAFIGAFFLFGTVAYSKGGKDKQGNDKQLGGLFGVMLRGFGALARASKDLEKANESLVVMAGVVALLSLAVLTLVLAGAMVISGWPAVLATGAFMLVVLGVFLAVGMASKGIREGGQELFYIAATVGILGVTALIMVLAGSLIATNLGKIMTVGLFMVVLVSIFMLVGLATKWIDQGGKELFYIAAAVGIIGAIALVLVAAGGLIKTNWGSITAMGLMMIILVGLFVGLAFAASKVEKGALVMGVIVVGITLLAISVMIILKAMEGREPGELLAIMGILAGFVALFMVMMGVAAAASVAVAAGAVVMGAAIGCMFLITILVKDVIAAVKDIEATGKTDQEMKDILMIPLKAIIDVVNDENLKNVSVEGETVRKIRRMKRIMRQITSMARMLQKIASMSMPVEWDKNGNPTKYEQMDNNAFGNAALNAKAILVTCASIFTDGEVTIETANGEKTTIKNVPVDLDGIKKSTVKKVRKLKRMVRMIGRMAETLQHMASLNMPLAWDKDGKPIAFQAMTAENFKDAALNAGGILHFFVALFSGGKKDLNILKTKLTIGGIDMTKLDSISLKATMKVGKIGAMVKLIGGMAKTLQNLASMTVPDPLLGFNTDGTPKGYIKMDAPQFSAAAKNAMGILKLCLALFDDNETTVELEGMSPVTVTGISLEELETNIMPRHKRKMDYLGQMVGSVGGMAATIQNLAVLKTPNADAGFNADGTPKEWMVMKDSQFNDAAKNLGIIVSCVIQSLADNAGHINDIKKRARGTLAAAGSLLGGLGPLCNSVVELTKTELDQGILQTKIDTVLIYPITAMGALKDTDVGKAEKNLVVYERIVNSMCGGGDSKGLGAINDNNSKNFQNNVKEVAGLVRQVGGTDVTKLKYASDMMKRMSEFSRSINGNFKELAKVINEDLITAIEKLETTMGKINDSTPVPAPAAQVGSVIEKPSGTAGNTPKEKAKNTKPNGKQDNAVVVALEGVQKEITSLRNTLVGVIESGAVKTREKP